MRPIRLAAVVLAAAVLAAPAFAQRQLPAPTPQRQAAPAMVTVNIGCELRTTAHWGMAVASFWMVNTQAYPLPAGAELQYFYTVPVAFGSPKMRETHRTTRLYQPLAPGAAMSPPEDPGFTPTATSPRACRATASFVRRGW